MIEPFYKDESVTIFHGDSREIMPTLSGIGLVLTDPPYGISHPTDYAARGRGKLADCSDYIPVYGDNEPFDPAAILALEVPTILWGANYFADKLPISCGAAS
jgi:DNA modification methylase